MRREDLMVDRELPCDTCHGRTHHHLLPVSDADLASLGLMQRPVCEKCEGSGYVDCPNAEIDSTHECGGQICPSCGGLGFGHVVTFDQIEWHVRDRLYSNCDHDHVRAPHGRGCLDPSLASEALGVALDGIDVEVVSRLRGFVIGLQHRAVTDGWSEGFRESLDQMAALLAAIDQEDTDA